MERKKTLKEFELRQFGFLIGIGLPLLIGWLIPLIIGHDFRIWTIYISIPSIFSAIIYPKLLINPYKFWMLLGEILGWFNSRLILSAIFYIVLLPISIMMKAFGYDPLRTKKVKSDSYKEYVKDKSIDLNRIF